ncbi:phage exclusion protein [Escherichia coli]|nr:phage exclusion protein [Escherichia coli]
MAKVFTQEEREKIKGQVVELVRRSVDLPLYFQTSVIT